MNEKQNTVENVVPETVVEDQNQNIEILPEVVNNIPSEVINNKTISLSTLRVLMEENFLIKRIISKIVKNYEEITVTEIQKLVTSVENNFTRWNIISALKKLQKLGFLYFISGRKGKQSRIVWNVSTRKLNFAIKNDTIGGELEIISNKYNTQVVKVEKEKGTTHKHSFQLRPDFKINIFLPKNIQKEEITRFSTFITTLATTEEKVMT